MKKISALFLAFCILNLSFSCTTSKILAYENMDQEDTEMEYLIVHSNTSRTYSLYNFRYTEEGIEGELRKFKSKNGFFIHVYTNKDIGFSIKKDTGLPYLINRDDITKIKYSETDIGKTIFEVSGAFLGLFLIASIIDFSVNGLDISGMFQ